VLADKAASDRLRAARDEHRALRREEDLLRIARGAIRPAGSGNTSIHAAVGDEAAPSDGEDIGDDGSDDDDDDDFMRSYREARLRGHAYIIIMDRMGCLLRSMLMRCICMALKCM
jgi:hypothetical protein